MKIVVDIIKESNLWKEQKYIKKTLVKKIINLIESELEVFKKTENLELAILLTDNEKIKILNNQFRKKDKATNVLSFPDRELNWEKLNEEDFAGDVILGDIALAYEIIESESLASNLPIQNHFTHLLLHAILHLLGYDHEEEKDGDVMRVLEIKILSKLDIKTPSIYA